jgi:uncharacterized iron-regulated membrane protein
MAVSGSLIVWQAELSPRFSIEWLVKAHDNLLAKSYGRAVNGFGGIGLLTLCATGAVIWWPGIKNWRRSLVVSRRASFPRINWDLHSALGFWSFPFVLVWAVSAVYFGFPHLADPLFLIDPKDRVTDLGLFWLSQLHFGRLGWLAEIVWSLLGLVPAILAFTGVFICCRRMIYKKPSNPNTSPH